MSAASIKFLNLLEEAKYAFLAGTPEGYAKSETLLAEAHAMASDAADARNNEKPSGVTHSASITAH